MSEEIRKKRRNLEDMLQIAITATLRKTFSEDELVIHHSPNGGARDKREGAKLRAMGVLAGFTDYLFFWPERVEHGGSPTKTGRMDSGLIELKVPGNKALGIVQGTLNENQEIFRDRILAMGGKWAMAYSFEEMHATLIEWGVQPKAKGMT